MDIGTDAARGAERKRPGPAARRGGLRAALAVGVVAALTAAAGALALSGTASAAPTTLRAGAEADGRYFGVAVGQGDLGNSAATNVAGTQFDMVTPENEMKWDTIEPNNGQFNFGPGDAIVNFATSHNERVRGHNLVWHSQLPGWVSGLPSSQVKGAMESHITGEVSHYQGKIYAWDVVNEPFNDDGSFRNDVFYNAFGGGAQYIGDAIRTAHAADPAAKLYINDYNIEGLGSKSNAMYSLAQTLLSQGVPLSGIGFESHFITGQVPSNLQANMQRFADLGLDVAITELDDRMPTPASSANLQQQAVDDSNVVKACLAITHCPGITQWNISDADSWVPGTFPGQGAATMFDNNYQPKASFNSVLSALAAASPPPTSSPSTPPSSPPSSPPLASGPCDIYSQGGTPCVAAHSTTRALYGGYNGPLYQVRRSSDNTTTNIGVLSAGGYANAAAQDTFCANTTCVITVIYDQSGKGNNLTDAPGGGAAGGPDNLANATAAPTTLNGHKAYGVYSPSGTGYRDDNTSGIATGDQPEGEYAVLDGTHYNGGCCFDYGNAETNNNDDGNGTMEAIYFGNIKVWGYGTGNGPWIMADMENGLYSGQNAGYNANDPTVNYRYTTAIIKGTANQWAIRGGNAQSGGLSTFYSGPRPNVSGYNPMRKQGAIILGIGGDNSKGAAGTFYEGVMTSGYPSDATENAVQANINAAGYGATPPVTYPNLAASFNNVGITADNNTAPGSFDGNGASFSETALTNAKAAPGATVSASGVNFTFPNVAAGTNDNTVAESQVITMSGSGTLGFLLASAYGPATGTGTITYTDGSTQSYTLTATDWWATTPGTGNTLAVSSAYQNRQGNTTANQTGDIFAETVPLTAGKTVASVQLPAGGPIASGSASLHIFAIATTGSGTGSNTVTVANPGAQTGTVGTAISGVQVQGSDSDSSQTLTYGATGLPAGLSISSSGLITGTPTAAGNSSVTVTATDGTGASGMATFTWTVSPATGNTVTVANPGAQTGTVGTAITGLQVQGTDSASGQTLTYSATGLPAGLSISSSGLITGTPTTAGSSTVTVTATDGTGATGSATFTWTVTGTTPGVCHVAYTKASEWPGGFTANVVITNTGTTAINGWTVGFTFPGDQKITNAWSATTTQNGEAVTATNVSYNASIAPGANTSFGFQGTFTSNDNSPTSFTLNGTTCS